MAPSSYGRRFVLCRVWCLGRLTAVPHLLFFPSGLETLPKEMWITAMETERLIRARDHWPGFHGP